MTTKAPAYARLADVGREDLWAMIEQYAGPAWTASYEHPWERGRSTWQAVLQALSRAAGGERASVPAGRAPRFLHPLAVEQLDAMATRWSHFGGFDEVRLLERLGLVDLDHDDTYVLAVVGGFGDPRGTMSRADLLRDDPDVLDVVWRFFEVEGGGEVSLANLDKYGGGPSWKKDLGELVEDGNLPRERVLAACVQALGRDFSAFRAGWFSAFLESLAASAEELAPVQPQLRRLLGSHVTATVSVAVRALKTLSAAGLLDDDACPELAPALVGRTKGAALEVLRLLAAASGRRPDLVPVLARTAATALDHPDAAVQRAAAKLLDRLGAAELATQATGDLAPTVRRAIGALAEGAPLTSPGHIVPDPATADTFRSPLARPSGAELAEVLAALLEDADDPPALEGALAALVAADGPDLPASLGKRATSLLKRPAFVHNEPLRPAVARLVQLATGLEADPRGRPGTDLPEPLRARLAHVDDVLAGRAPRGPLLATPTSTDGWVDPTDLVTRLGDLPEPRAADLAASLLRLAPDGRGNALDALAALGRTDEVADAVRYALGGAPPAEPSTALRTRSVWAAASRARDPQADDPLLLAAGFTAPGEGHPVRAQLDVRLDPFTYTDTRGTHTTQHATFSVTLDSAPDRRLTRYNTLRGDRSISATCVRWAATMHPYDTEPVFSVLALHVLEALNYWEVDHTIPRALVALGHHPGRVGPMGAITAASGLGAQDGTHRVLAVDAVAALSSRRTLDAHALAAAMVTVAPATRLPRWAASLEQVAQAVGSEFVVDVLTEALPALPRDSRGLVKLLDVLAEESTRISRAVTDPTLRDYLTAFAGSSGAAGAARRVLALG